MHEVSARVEEFSEHLAQHGLFVAGSSGVQGEWPKLLLTQDRQGLLHLDHVLGDEDAARHFIVKFSRGSDAALAQILRHEPVYMDLARRLGLRVHAPLQLEGRVLFIPRFDRRVVAAGAGQVVERLAQESIASLTGYSGFDGVPSHDEVCRALVARCSDPQAEVLEYLRRDVANLALGNKDNHARNTALQRDFSGQVRLTPLFDFAPMYLHPTGLRGAYAGRAMTTASPTGGVCSIPSAAWRRTRSSAWTAPGWPRGCRPWPSPWRRSPAKAWRWGWSPTCMTTCSAACSPWPNAWLRWPEPFARMIWTSATTP
jgi:serine/threonine protein kinase HipA of HipAB toxin-antitoxin module